MQAVADSKGWEGTKDFGILLGVPNCNDVSRWVWVITDKGVESGIIVDCSTEWDHSLGLVADTNRADLTHEWAVIVMR